MLNSRTLFRLFVLMAPVVVWTGVEAAAAIADDRTPVEYVTSKPHREGEGLGTVEYRPSDKERPFFDKLDTQERVTGGLAGDYDIAAKEGKYVGWFGVVREVSEDAAAGQTTLLVEHKYFDGLTDAHIQAVSFNGSGDFRAVLRGVGHAIRPLSLVKVYGKVVKSPKGELPEVEAAFVRDWHWCTFTFLLASGTQHGSEKWRKLNQIDLEQIYNPYPDNTYYEQRLGKRPRDDRFYRRLLKPAGTLPPEDEKLMFGLIDALQAERLMSAGESVEAIQKAGQQRAAIAILLAVFRQDEDGILPSSICYALGRLAGPEQVPVLVAALDDANPDLRWRALDALTCMGRRAAPAVPALVKALGNSEAAVRGGAASALQAIGVKAQAAVEPLKKALRDRDGGVRVAAADALWAITFQAEPTVSVLVAALKDSDADLRSGAAEALERMGPAAVAAGPALIAALKDQEQFVRYSAAIALGSIRPESKTAVPALMATLKDEDSYVRAQAAEALGRYGSDAQSAAPALMAALKDEDGSVRWQSADALGEIGPAAATAIPALIEVLQHDSDDTARREAADALGLIDVAGREAVPALTHALMEESADVRRFAAIGLGKIGPNAKAALPGLHAATKDDDPAVQIAAAEALWKVGRDADAAMPVLLEALDTDDDTGPLTAAADAVGAIGPAAKAAVPSLIHLLGHEDGHVRNHAARALGSIGPDAEAAVPELIEALKSREGDTPTAVAAAEALWNINHHARAIPALIELLAVEDCTAGAAEALGRIGPAAKEALPALREAAKNPDPEVRQAVTEALRKVSEQAPAKAAKDQPKKP